MTINKLRFLDSLKHLPFTLEALANDLKKEGIDKFNITRDVFSHISTQNLEQYVLQKQKFPYSFMQDQSSFDYPRLPDIEHFTNDLSGEPCTPAEYAHAQNVWDIFECQTMRDYSRNYVKLDSVLLMDILLNYQTNMHAFFFLDPLSKVSIPSFGRATFRYHTRHLDIPLITSPDQYLLWFVLYFTTFKSVFNRHFVLFSKSMLRGGLSQCSKRIIDANIPELPTYDPLKPKTELHYLDVNTLYGYIQKERMHPVSGYRTLSDAELRTFRLSDCVGNKGNLHPIFHFVIESTFICYILLGALLVVDLDFPQDIEWQRKHQLMPFCPNYETVSFADLTEYQKKCLAHQSKLKNIENYTSLPHLTLSLRPKRKYPIHHAELQFYIDVKLYNYLHVICIHYAFNCFL